MIEGNIGDDSVLGGVGESQHGTGILITNIHKQIVPRRESGEWDVHVPVIPSDALAVELKEKEFFCFNVFGMNDDEAVWVGD
jgi:hypothetical protein